MKGFAGLFLAIAIVFSLAFLSESALPQGELPQEGLLRQKFMSEMAVKGALLDAAALGAREGESNYGKKVAAGIEADLGEEVGDAAYAGVAAAAGRCITVRVQENDCAPYGCSAGGIAGNARAFSSCGQNGAAGSAGGVHSAEVFIATGNGAQRAIISTFG